MPNLPKRVLLALTSHGSLGDTGKPTGYYVPEAAHPWEVFRKAGYEVSFVSVKGGRPPATGYNAEDEVQREFLEDPEVKKALADTPTADSLNPADYAAVYFVGGHGTMWDFPDAADLAALARDIYEAGGVVAAVCHGPAGLVNLKLSDGRYLVEGKEFAAFTNEEEDAVDLSVGAVPAPKQAGGARRHPREEAEVRIVRCGQRAPGHRAEPGFGLRCGRGDRQAAG